MLCSFHKRRPRWKRPASPCCPSTPVRVTPWRSCACTTSKQVTTLSRSFRTSMWRETSHWGSRCSFSLCRNCLLCYRWRLTAVSRLTLKCRMNVSLFVFISRCPDRGSWQLFLSAPGNVPKQWSGPRWYGHQIAAGRQISRGHQEPGTRWAPMSNRQNVFVHKLFTIAFIVNRTGLVYYHTLRFECWVTDSQASVHSGLKQTGSTTGWCSLAQAQLKLHRYSDSALSCSQGKARLGL